MFTTNNSKPSTIPPHWQEGEPAATTTSIILRKSKEATSNYDPAVETIIGGPDIQYECNRPSQIHSSSYRSDIRHNGESHRLEESTQMKIVSTRKEESDSRGRVSIASTGSRLLAAFLGKKQEHDYSTYIVPKLNPDDRKKHRDFFSQLDDTDDDASVPAAGCTYDDTIHSNEKHETIKALENCDLFSQLNSTDDDAFVPAADSTDDDTIYSDDNHKQIKKLPKGMPRSDATAQEILEGNSTFLQRISFSTFLQRIHCGCTCECTDIGMDENKQKGETINPVAVVSYNTYTASLFDEE